MDSGQWVAELVRHHGNELILLPILLLELPLRLDELLAFVELPKRQKLVEHALIHVAVTGLGVVEEQVRQLFLLAHQLENILLHLDLGMHERPKMCGANECQKTHQMLEIPSADRAAQCACDRLASCRGQKQHGQADEQIILGERAGLGPVRDPRSHVEARQRRRERLGRRHWPTEQLHDRLHGVMRRVRVTRGPAQPRRKPTCRTMQ
ncbi:MAG: hypothetical protein WDO24_31455 [Pseudomonadota bacterium]